MSIFKVKQWWSNDALQHGEVHDGIQNANSLKVDRFHSHHDTDCILVGEGSFLKVYKPSNGAGSSSLLLEVQLSNFVLHVDTGKFTGSCEDRQIIVLHPQSYEIYELKRKVGHTEAGEQNILAPVIKHSFTRKADSLACGPFGNIKTRDLICVETLDGSLSFFDQDTFLFMCRFNDVIIPGPVCYIPSCDSFVISKSTWALEIYSYQQLQEFSELNVRPNKKNIPQWAYNAGEEIAGFQIIQTSSNFSSIIALGERHLYCFQDNGLMKYMIKFDFMPISFCAYLIGWYYEPGARLLVMVTSDDAKLFVYEGTTLLWSSALLTPAISISRCFLKSLPGGLVTLSNKGIVKVCYLGTAPDLNSNAPQMINETVEPEQVQAELEVAEEALRKILNENEDAENRGSMLEDLVKIKADVGKPIQNLFQEYDNDNVEALHLLMCPIITIITCQDPKLIQEVQITYICIPPFTCTEPKICLNEVNGTEIVENHVFLGGEADISDIRVKILFTITDSIGKIVVLDRTVLLPLNLYCTLSEISGDIEVQLRIQPNRACVEFSKVFSDFTEADITEYGDTITFSYRSTKKTVTLKNLHNQYIIEAADFTDITATLDQFLIQLADHHERMNVNDFDFKLSCDKDAVKLLIHTFLKYIEVHAKERIKLKESEDELNVLQKQFTIIQKRLLVQYGSLPPGDCDPLEFLMKDTHERIFNIVNKIMQSRESVCRAGSSLIAVGSIIIRIIKQSSVDPFKVKLLEEMMCLNTLYEHYQEWEESVTQALTYIVNNVLKKSDKDKEKLATVTEQGILSHINLKRFLKQLRMVLDTTFEEILQEHLDNVEKVTRIEEIVDVI